MFGRGRLPGVCTAWVLVKHRSDCRTRQPTRLSPAVEPQGESVSNTVAAVNHAMRTSQQRPSIELRVIVQNTGPSCASLRVEVPHSPVHILNGATMAKAALVQEYPRVPHLISVNGEPWTGSTGRDSRGEEGGGGGGGAISRGLTPIHFLLKTLFLMKLSRSKAMLKAGLMS